MLVTAYFVMHPLGKNKTSEFQILTTVFKRRVQILAKQYNSGLKINTIITVVSIRQFTTRTC